MHLARVEISDFRSVFADEKRAPFALDLAVGSNTLVGPNNCGKSNVLRAVALVLDPNASYAPSVDNPGPRPFAHPVITLHFLAADDDEEDAGVLASCDSYESSLSSGTTFAAGGRIVLRVTFDPTPDGPRRRETLLTPSHVSPSLPEQFQKLEQAIRELRERVRFVLISSGESIRSVLDGNFREILHSVVKDRLAGAFETAEESRAAYVSGLTESLLGPLRERLETDLGQLFPEIEHALLTPDVPTIERTLSSVNVSLQDLVTTPLSEKGTGVRGGVLVAMLSYLAQNATRDMILALEEPEAFLHPASQEDLRDRLDQIASNPDVTLLVTTHSPYITTKSATGKVFGLAKDGEGRTRISAAISGDDDHSGLVGRLFRESTFEDLLKRASELPEEAQAVLIVEGEGDKASLELAARVVGRPDLLDGFHISAAGGATKLVATAVIARASTEKPVLVLLDNDENGRRARDFLVGDTFRFQKNREVLTYAAVMPEAFGGFPVEAEDLFDPALIRTFVETHGEAIVDGMQRRPDEAFHYDFGTAAKELLGAFLNEETEPSDVRLWLELITKLRHLAGLEDLEVTVDELIEGAPHPAIEPEAGRAMIVTGSLDYPRFQERDVLIIDPSVEVPSDVSRIGFYTAGEIKPDLPRVLQHYPTIHFSRETVDQLRSTGSELDGIVADMVEHSVKVEDQLAGATHQLILLTPADDPETMSLEHSISNTKEIAGKSVAWTVGPRFVAIASLLAAPQTTTELDKLEAETQ